MNPPEDRDAPAPSAEVVELTAKLKARDEREREHAASAQLRAAFRCLQPLIADLPAADTFLLLPDAVKSWQVLRDQDADAYLVYLAQVRARCGHQIALLVQNRVGAPRKGAALTAPLKCVSLAEMVERARAQQEWTIKRLLPRRGVGSIFAAYSSGKTFVAFDMVAAIGRGLEAWMGHRVTGRGGAIYIAAEGSEGMGKRIAAYALHHGIKVEDVAVVMITARVDLRNPGAQLDELITAIRDAAERIGTVVVVVIDTLTQTMPGGSDSKIEDMSAYIDNCRALGAAVDAFVLIVHHGGKDPTKGSRGSTALPCAVDVEIEVTFDKEQRTGVITVNKERDEQGGAEIGFRLDVLEVWKDTQGDPVTSCVVVPAPAGAGAATTRKDYDGATKTALQALQEAVTDHGQTMAQTSTIPGGVRAVRLKQWRERFELRYGEDGDTERDFEAVKKAFTRSKAKLLGHKVVGISKPWCWLW